MAFFPEAPEPSHAWSLLGLGALLLGMWLLLTHAEDVAYPTVDYSLFYSWLEGDKVESVAIDWPFVEGQLEAPEQVGDDQRKSFRTVLSQSDDALLPLLREKKVGIVSRAKGHPSSSRWGWGRLATKMVAHYGMSEALGPAYYDHPDARELAWTLLEESDGPCTRAAFGTKTLTSLERRSGSVA